MPPKQPPVQKPNNSSVRSQSVQPVDDAIIDVDTGHEFIEPQNMPPPQVPPQIQRQQLNQNQQQEDVVIVTSADFRNSTNN